MKCMDMSCAICRPGADPSRTGYVYAVQVGDVDGAVKLGWSKEPWARKARLESDPSCPGRLVLLGYQRAHPLYEGVLHWEAREGWVKGEWFRPCPQVVSVVRWLSRWCDDHGMRREWWEGFDPLDTETYALDFRDKPGPMLKVVE